MSSPSTKGRAAFFVTLGALPMAFMLFSIIFRFHSGSFWIWHHIDPSYFYLFNGLMLGMGETPADVFHPGTPVQMLAALILRIGHPFATGDELARLVLADPEPFLKKISTSIILMNVVALFMLGRSAWRAFGRLLPALAAQTSPFVSMFVIKHAYHVKPEPFLLLAATLLGALLFEAIRRQESARSCLPVGFGAVVGFGMASKLLFAPLALVPLFVLATRKAVGVYLVAVLAFFLIFLLPAIGNWDVSASYFARMAMGSGAYGAGEATVADWASYPGNLMKVFAGKLIFDIVLLLSLAALATRWKRGLERTLSWRALEGLVLAQLVMALLVAKHPIAHYMVAAVSVTGIQAALLLILGEDLFGRPAWWRPACVVVLILVGMSRVTSFLTDDSERMDWRRKAMALGMTPYESCTQVFFDFASEPSYALFMGDMMTNWRFAPLLAELYPAKNQVFMNFHTGEPRRWNQKVDLQAEINQRPCTVLRGAWDDAMKSYLAGLAPDAKISSQCEAGQEKLITIGVEAKCWNQDPDPRKRDKAPMQPLSGMN
ncbi:MAG: hypothetical protein EPN26_06285 [Rhodospirillales bacterium]|nr:MAG: hypothetical protein EPN26_06285 [Rhodospirillales bacterium]